MSQRSICRINPFFRIKTCVFNSFWISWSFIINSWLCYMVLYNNLPFGLLGRPALSIERSWVSLRVPAFSSIFYIKWWPKVFGDVFYRLLVILSELCFSFELFIAGEWCRVKLILDWMQVLADFSGIDSYPPDLATWRTPRKTFLVDSPSQVWNWTFMIVTCQDASSCGFV